MAMTANPPITIITCRAENFGGYGGQVADVAVTFVNAYASSASSVRFGLTYHGKLALATAKGTYAPNVKVTERFHVFVDQFYKGKTMDDCGVVHAAFADGSAWPP